jgi:serine/threonine protein kinase
MSGSYSYPPGLDLPEELKHLISQMLKVDSRERISVPDIKKHPWFNSIPFQNPDTQEINPEEPISDVDEEIVKALQLMNVGWDNLLDLRAHLRQAGYVSLLSSFLSSFSFSFFSSSSFSSFSFSSLPSHLLSF